MWLWVYVRRGIASRTRSSGAGRSEPSGRGPNITVPISQPRTPPTSYSATAILKGLDQSGKAGAVKVIGFDVTDETLSGIESGQIAATIMQDQFGCGYHAVRILGQNARGDRSELPVFDKQTLPCNVVTKDNIASIRARLSGQPAPTTNAG